MKKTLTILATFALLHSAFALTPDPLGNGLIILYQHELTNEMKVNGDIAYFNAAGRNNTDPAVYTNPLDQNRLVINLGYSASNTVYISPASGAAGGAWTVSGQMQMVGTNVFVSGQFACPGAGILQDFFSVTVTNFLTATNLILMGSNTLMVCDSGLDNFTLDTAEVRSPNSAPYLTVVSTNNFDATAWAWLNSFGGGGSGGTMNFDGGAITSDGGGNVTIAGTLSADAGQVTSDSTGALTLAGQLAADSGAFASGVFVSPAGMFGAPGVTVNSTAFTGVDPMDLNADGTAYFISGGAAIIPDSGGSGGVTLMLNASDTGTPMYIHITSSGSITATTSP